MHPLIEFEQRAGKSGVPNFKSVDEIDRLINNNPYVGTSENNGLRNLRLLFNYIIKDKIARVVGHYVVIPAYARTSTSWPASYLVYYNNAFRTIKYGGTNPTPLLDVVYSPTTNRYYGVACSTSIQVIREQTFNGIGLLMSYAVPIAGSWTSSNIDFPKTFWSDYRLGYLTVLK